MSVNAYRGESEVTIPAEFLDAPDGVNTTFKVALRFTHSSYLELERLTGIKHFVRLQNPALMMGEDFIPFALYAGTRRTKPELTLRQINEWLDAVPPHKLKDVFTEIQAGFVASLVGPMKEDAKIRADIDKRLNDVDPKKLDTVLEFLKNPDLDKPEEEQLALPLEMKTEAPNPT